MAESSLSQDAGRTPAMQRERTVGIIDRPTGRDHDL